MFSRSVSFIRNFPSNLMHSDLRDSLTGSEDKRHRRKNGSHFSEARKRGRTMLYHLTSQFSRDGKREVSLGGVSTFTALSPSLRGACYSSTLSEIRSFRSHTCGTRSCAWIINADIWKKGVFFFWKSTNWGEPWPRSAVFSVLKINILLLVGSWAKLFNPPHALKTLD